mmetsp:Transcript_2572/g.4833  ORF Transcript_2572/g.4833 Transcript_2572/m.4833 type:complete len:273 (+) Transcript_2572:1229-2047(+)
MIIARSFLVKRPANEAHQATNDLDFKLDCARPSNFKRLTYTSAGLNVDLLRISLSKSSADGFHQEAYLLYPSDHKHFSTLASSRTFKALCGLDAPAVAYKASNGRLSMYNFSGMASSLSGAVLTGLRRTTVDPEVALDIAAGDARPIETRAAVFASYFGVHRERALEMPELQKARVVHAEGCSVWFQLTLNRDEHQAMKTKIREMKRKQAKRRKLLRARREEDAPLCKRTQSSHCKSRKQRRERRFECATPDLHAAHCRQSSCCKKQRLALI